MEESQGPPQTMAEPQIVGVMQVVPAKKCQIEHVLPASLLEILKLSPSNPTVRAQVHARILFPIPEGKQTYPEIQEWIEANITPGAIPPSPQEPHYVPGTTFNYHSDYSCYETGRCDFSRNVNGSAQYQMDECYIREIIEDGLRDGDSWNSIQNAIRSAAIEAVNENPPDTEVDYDSVDYSDEEVLDSESIAELGGHFNANLAEYISRNLPDLRARIRDECEGGF